MTLSWTTNDIDGAAESAHENFAALMSSDELTRWFEPGGLRDLRTAERGFESIRKENLPKISGTRGGRRNARVRRPFLETGRAARTKSLWS